MAGVPAPSSRFREIGDEAVWSLSSAKPGNGVEQIRDDSVETYWQSDGGQPHLINVQFHRKMHILEIAFYLDYTLDESYTPKKISIRLGSTFHDLVEVQTVDLHEPSGWVTIPLAAEADLGAEPQGLRAYFLQVCVVSMHQNGRDTHVRQARIYGPRVHIDQVEPLLPRPCTVAFSQFSVLR
ncbi:anaphase-promoting complex, subunit 10/DOC domain-containing protein [Pelagophyceae sp. CCMP2097]|nr:anaphase-promoting complex, subunit 10/DOC domain-containing protein [Pelagophyceae sp. CCMP2097]